MKKDSIGELEREILFHNYRYFVLSDPLISDQEFDGLVVKLKKLNPSSKVLRQIGSDIPLSTKKNIIEHSIPMLSLDKSYDLESLEKWTENFNGDLVQSPKVDGLAAAIHYNRDGILACAATRGNGFIGENITQNIFMVDAIPLQIPLSNCEIRGEIYMNLSVFKQFKETFKSPRNLAAGAIKQKNPEKTKEFNLSFLAYDLLGKECNEEWEKIELLRKFGFHSVNSKKISKNELKQSVEVFLEEHTQYDYEVDGIVYKVNSMSEQKRLGETNHHPRYALAYKLQGESGITHLFAVEWNVSRTGTITPCAIIEPIKLSGAVINRTSLHNLGNFKKLDLRKNAKVMITRRGGVIPNLESVTSAGRGEALEIPKECPSCGRSVVTRDDFLYCAHPQNCRNTQISFLEHFVKALEIDGFGRKWIEILYDEKLVKEPSDLCTLTIEDLLKLPRMGDVLAEKLINNISTKKSVTLEQFLLSLGIDDLGGAVSKILADMFGSLEKILELDEEELMSIHSIGDIIAKNIVRGLEERKEMITKLLRFITIEKINPVSKGPLQNKTFVFTGTLKDMTRKDAETKVKSLGGKILSQVTKQLDYLVVAEDAKESTKLKKAREYEIHILNEKGFLEIIGKSDK